MRRLLVVIELPIAVCVPIRQRAEQLALQQQFACQEYCSGHGECHLGICLCDEGWAGDDCGQVQPPFSCAYNCSGHGVCQRGRCICDEFYDGPSCAHSSGCPNRCSGQGRCVRGRCFCEDGAAGDDCSQPAHTCPNSCGGTKRGVCVDGGCRCFPGVRGSACELSTPSRMICVENCSWPHGSCHEAMKSCRCARGFAGMSCQEAVPVHPKPAIPPFLICGISVFMLVILIICIATAAHRAYGDGFASLRDWLLLRSGRIKQAKGWYPGYAKGQLPGGRYERFYG